QAGTPRRAFPTNPEWGTSEGLRRSHRLADAAVVGAFARPPALGVVLPLPALGAGDLGDGVLLRLAADLLDLLGRRAGEPVAVEHGPGGGEGRLGFPDLALERAVNLAVGLPVGADGLLVAAQILRRGLEVASLLFELCQFLLLGHGPSPARA